MTVKQNGKKLIIEIDMDDEPKPSSTGKSITRASTRGNVTTSVVIDGKPLIVAVNAYTKVK